MKEIKIHDDESTVISIFKDNHYGVVIQMYRYVQQLIPGEGGVLVEKRNKAPINTIKVSVMSADKKQKTADTFNADVKLALDEMNKMLQQIQFKDKMIDGVLNDYESRQRTREARPS